MVVVGAANTAVQVGYELAKVATVTLATRTPIRFPPQRPLGRDVHFWSAASGFDHLPIGHLLKNWRPLFTAIDGDTVTWPDGTREHVDTILLATGYRAGLSYLDQAERGHRKGISTAHPGLATWASNGSAASPPPPSATPTTSCEACCGDQTTSARANASSS